jgi:hypothetical protein
MCLGLAIETLVRASASETHACREVAVLSCSCQDTTFSDAIPGGHRTCLSESTGRAIVGFGTSVIYLVARFGLAGALGTSSNLLASGVLSLWAPSARLGDSVNVASESFLSSVGFKRM